MTVEQPELHPRPRRSPVELTLWVLAILLGVFHYAVVWMCSVDVPFQDEWAELPVHVSPGWIWTQHNEHRIVLTKIIAAVLLRLDGWNLAHEQRLNFTIYLGLIAATLALLKRSAPALPGMVYPLVAIWLLSPLPHENHQWAFQNQFHFVPIFAILGAMALAARPDGPISIRNLLVATAFLLLGILSMASGLLAAWVLLGLRTATLVRRTAELRRLLPLWILVAVVSMVYFHGLEKNQISAGPAGPWTGNFWIHFLTMLGAGWGLALPSNVAWIAGPPFLLATLTPWFLLARRPGGLTSVLPAFLALSTLLAILVSISYGRGSFGASQALASRYKEYTILMFPLCLPAWYAVWQDSRRWSLWGPRIALCLLGTGWLVSLDRFSLYRQSAEIRLANQAKLATCLQNGTACTLNGIAVGDLSADYLASARAAGLSFIRSALVPSEGHP